MKVSMKIALGFIGGCLTAFVLIFCGILAGVLKLAKGPTSSYVGPVPVLSPGSTLEAKLTSTYAAGSELSSMPEQCVTSDGFEITIDKYEFSDSYEYDSWVEGGIVIHKPPEGAKFVSVHITVEHKGIHGADAPSNTDFDMLYIGEKVEESWYERVGYQSYDDPDWSDKEYPGVVIKGWLHFEVPKAADAADLELRFYDYPEGPCSWRLSP